MAAEYLARADAQMNQNSLIEVVDDLLTLPVLEEVGDGPVEIHIAEIPVVCGPVA